MKFGSKESVSVAVVNFLPKTENFDFNITRICTVCKKIINQNANVSIIVFPEMALYGYDNLQKLELLGKNYVNCKVYDSLRKLNEFCENYDCAVVVGFPFFRNNKIYNEICFVCKNFVSEHYSKNHLIPFERNVFSYGTRFLAVQTEFWKIGFLICWDCAFPEPARLYAKNNVDMLVICSAWEKPYDSQFEIAVRARAMENGIYAVASNMGSQNSETEFFGKSIIVDPLGNILKKCGSSDGEYAVCTICKNDIVSARSKFSSQIFELREDIYSKNLLTENI